MYQAKARFWVLPSPCGTPVYNPHYFLTYAMSTRKGIRAQPGVFPATRSSRQIP